MTRNLIQIANCILKILWTLFIEIYFMELPNVDKVLYNNV